MTKENASPKQTPQTGNVAFWYDPRKRSILYQLGVLAMVGLLGYYLISNTLANLERQNIATGFGFLEKEASFEIGESLIPYSAADKYARALMVGVLNTLLVSFIGVVLTDPRDLYRHRPVIYKLDSKKTGSCLYRGLSRHSCAVAAFLLVCLFL